MRRFGSKMLDLSGRPAAESMFQAAEEFHRAHSTFSFELHFVE